MSEFPVTNSEFPTIESQGDGVKISRGNQVYFDSTKAPLIFEDQFLQISSTLEGTLFQYKNFFFFITFRIFYTTLIARNVYGVGETEHVRFNLDRNFYQQGLFARDNFQGIHENLWGVHPYFTAMTESGSAYGILLFNSNAMDITFNRKMVTWRTTGGILDFFIFTGPSKDFHQISLKLFFYLLRYNNKFESSTIKI